MNGNDRISGDRQRLVDNLAAELTEAAYAVALKHEKPDSWIDLELDLWHAMGEAVQRWLPQGAERRERRHEAPAGVQPQYVSC